MLFRSVCRWRGISFLVVPIPAHAFFKQAVLEREFGDELFQVARFAPQILHLARRRLPRRVAGEAPLLADGESEIGFDRRRRLVDVVAVERQTRFEPQAVAYHANRPGWMNMLRRNYRWAYTAVESKSQTRSTRMSWLYRFPALTVAASLPLSMVQGMFIVACWLRAGKLEPLLMTPIILVTRVAYALGMTVGGVRWLLGGRTSQSRCSETRIPW